MRNIKISVKKVTYIRNGIDGAPYHVVLFKTPSCRGLMVGIVFDEKHHVAVINATLLAEGLIGYEGDDESKHNAYRGDYYEYQLRQACGEYQAGLSAKLGGFIPPSCPAKPKRKPTRLRRDGRG